VTADLRTDAWKAHAKRVQHLFRLWDPLDVLASHDPSNELDPPVDEYDTLSMRVSQRCLDSRSEQQILDLITSEFADLYESQPDSRSVTRARALSSLVLESAQRYHEQVDHEQA